MQDPFLLLSLMAGLHLIWLITIWWTKTSTNSYKIPRLIVFVLFITALAFLIPDAAWTFADAWIVNFSANPLIAGLSLAVFTLAVGLIYAQKQRVWPFDEEGNYEAAAYFAEHGWREFFEHYSQFEWLGKQHPPLVPIFGGLFIRLFGPRLFSFRIFSVVLSAGTVLLTSWIGARLFGNLAGFLAGIILLSFPLFFRLGSVAMLEIPITFLTTLVLFLALNLNLTSNLFIASIMGVLIGIGLISKYTMSLVLAVLLVHLVLSNNFVNMGKHFVVEVLVGFSVFGVWLIYAARSGIFKQQSKLIKNYAGVTDKKASKKRKSWSLFGRSRIKYRLEVLLTRLPSAIGPHHIVLIVLGVWQLIVLQNRHAYYLLGWVLPIAVPLLLFLPDHRYFLQLFPALALTGAFFLSTLPVFSPVLFLIFALWLGSLYLFVDWFREQHLFLNHLDNRKLQEKTAE